MATNLFGSLKSRYGVDDALTQSTTSLRTISRQFLSNTPKLFNGACYTPPCIALLSGVAFTIQAKRGVIASFNEPIPTLLGVLSPALD
jgi:hypothetical protein